METSVHNYLCALTCRLGDISTEMHRQARVYGTVSDRLHTAAHLVNDAVRAVNQILEADANAEPAGGLSHDAQSRAQTD